MARGYLPSTDDGLRNWGHNFSTLIVAGPTAYGLTPEQAQAFQLKQQAYVQKLTLATEPPTRTRKSIADKNDARDALKAEARHLVSIIQTQPNVTDGQKYELGITVRDAHPSPVPPPSESPTIKVLSMTGRRLKIQLEGAGPRNARPAGVAGATVLTHLGAQPPADTVWITAFWFNPRKESGPAAVPMSVNLPAAAAVPADAKLKIAA